jgi:hypothetical protein
MKKTFLISLTLFLFSCNDQVNQFLEVDPDYNIFMILQSDNYSQSGVITSTYFGNGYDPTVNYTEPFVKNALVKLYYKDTVKIFSEGKVPVNMFSTDSDTISAYYNNDCYIEPDEVVELKAIINSERTAYSYVHMPDSVYFDLSVTDKVIPPLEKDELFVKWQPEERDVIFLPRLRFRYYKDGKEYFKVVPIAYAEREDTSFSVYPHGSSFYYYTYSMENINRAMEEISEGDFRKENYKIMEAYWEVSTLDENLSTFYSANYGSNANYDVSLNRVRFDNIEGAKGILGGFTVSRLKLKFKADYISSFGYIVGIPD